MITSLFRKSTPLNYALLILAVVVFFFLYQIGHASAAIHTAGIIKKVLLLGALFASLFTVNFIVKKNGLSKDSSYSILFYFLFLLFFPSVLDNFNVVVSNFFVLLAMRRLISLHSLKAPKEKIFDASLWIFVATLFHFWSILFVVMVFVSILFHVARDYRNWLLPFIAFFAIAVGFLFFALVFNESLVGWLFESMQTNIRVDYFTNNYQNLALSLYATVALFFLASMFLTLSNRPLILHSSYKKIISAFVIGVIVFIVSASKSSDLLVFTFAPLAMMATSHIELQQEIWKREAVLAGVILCSLVAFFTQL